MAFFHNSDIFGNFLEDRCSIVGFSAHHQLLLTTGDSIQANPRSMESSIDKYAATINNFPFIGNFLRRSAQHPVRRPPFARSPLI